MVATADAVVEALPTVEDLYQVDESLSPVEAILRYSRSDLIPQRQAYIRGMAATARQADAAGLRCLVVLVRQLLAEANSSAGGADDVMLLLGQLPPLGAATGALSELSQETSLLLDDAAATLHSANEQVQMASLRAYAAILALPSDTHPGSPDSGERQGHLGRQLGVLYAPTPRRQQDRILALRLLAATALHVQPDWLEAVAWPMFESLVGDDDMLVREEAAGNNTLAIARAFSACDQHLGPTLRVFERQCRDAVWSVRRAAAAAAPPLLCLLLLRASPVAGGHITDQEASPDGGLGADEQQLPPQQQQQQQQQQQHPALQLVTTFLDTLVKDVSQFVRPHALVAAGPLAAAMSTHQTPPAALLQAYTAAEGVLGPQGLKARQACVAAFEDVACKVGPSFWPQLQSLYLALLGARDADVARGALMALPAVLRLLQQAGPGSSPPAQSTCDNAQCSGPDAQHDCSRHPLLAAAAAAAASPLAAVPLADTAPAALLSDAPATLMTEPSLLDAAGTPVAAAAPQPEEPEQDAAAAVAAAAAAVLAARATELGNTLVVVFADLLEVAPPPLQGQLLQLLPQLLKGSHVRAAPTGPAARRPTSIDPILGCGRWRARLAIATRLADVAACTSRPGAPGDGPPPAASRDAVLSAALALCGDSVAAVRLAAAEQLGRMLAAEAAGGGMTSAGAGGSDLGDSNGGGGGDSAAAFGAAAADETLTGVGSAAGDLQPQPQQQLAGRVVPLLLSACGQPAVECPAAAGDDTGATAVGGGDVLPPRTHRWSHQEQVVAAVCRSYLQHSAPPPSCLSPRSPSSPPAQPPPPPAAPLLPLRLDVTVQPLFVRLGAAGAWMDPDSCGALGAEDLLAWLDACGRGDFAAAAVAATRLL